MAGAIETVKAMFSWVMNEADLIWGKQAKKRDALNILNEQASTGFHETAWKHISPELKADPDVKQAYEKSLKRDEFYENEAKQSLDYAMGGVEKFITSEFFPSTVTAISDSYAKAKAFALLDLGKDLGMGALGLGVEIASAGQIDTFTKSWQFVRSKTGFGGISTMVLRAPLEMALIRPLSYHLHDAYRNELPDMNMISDMSVKGNLERTNALKGFGEGIFGVGKNTQTDKDLFDAIGGYRGYEQWYIDALWDTRWRELRLGEIAWAMTDATIDDAKLDKMLQYAKYNPDDRPILISILKEKYYKPYRSRLEVQYRNMYKVGYISAQDFRIKLAKIGIPLNVRDWLVEEADLIAKQDLNADMIAAYTAQFLKDPAMSEAEFRTQLSSVIVDPARVEPLIMKARISRSKVPVLPTAAKQGVKITSKPSWSQIMVDYVDTGLLSPETVEITPGVHTITIYADGYEPYTEEVTITEGQFVEVHAVLVEIPAGA